MKNWFRASERQFKELLHLISFGITDVNVNVPWVAGQGQVVEIKENGLPETEGTFNHLDLSSVGDITIDSVKDHMVK